MTKNGVEFKNWYFVIVGFFYAGQGYALGSMVLLLPLYMLNELGAPSRSAAVFAAALIIFPWYVKFIFGIITDNYNIGKYRRKPYLIIATLFSFVGWSTLGLSNSIYPWFVVSGILLAIGSALGDAVIDGMSIEITPLSYAGRLQGVNWGSRGLGLGAAGIISANIVDKFGWDELFLVAGTIGVSITIVTLILPEKPKIIEMNTDIVIVSKLKEIFSQIAVIFRRKRSKDRVLYFLFSGFALSIILQLTLIMETEFDYDFETLGYGALSFAFGTFFGAIINGILADQRDDFSSFIGLSVAYGISIVSGYVFIFYRNFQAELFFFFVIGLFGGAYEAYQLKVIQEETVENLESTIFGIYTGISNIGQFAFGGLLIVFLADVFDIPILATMQLVNLVLIFAAYYLFKLKFAKND